MTHAIQPGYDPNEYGTALRIVDQHHDDLAWCENWGKWLVSDRKSGVWISDALVDYRAKAILTAIAQQVDHPNVNFRTLRHITNALNLSKPLLAVRPEQFDADPLIMGVPGGILDLKTCLVRPYAGEWLTMQCRVVPCCEWLAEETPLWVQHLRMMCHGDIELMEFLRRLAGMSLIGDQSLKPHLSPQLNGLGRNGKGAFLLALAWALGDYSLFASTRLLTTTENAHTTEQAALKGKRLVIVEEVKRINSSILKDLTGGGYMSARKMRADDESFLKSWTLWFNNNGPMSFAGDTSDGLWARVPRIELGKGLGEGEQDVGWVEKLKDESEGVFAWAVQGLVEFYEGGLRVPQKVVDATNTRRADADPLQMFLSEFYDLDMGGMELGSELVKLYETWTKERGERSGGLKVVYDELRSRFGLEVRTGAKNKTYIYGLKRKPLSLGELSEHWSN